MAELRRYQFGDFEFDLGTYQLRRGSDTQALEPKALDVLRLLLERAPHIVEKAEIFSIAWKDVAVTDNALTRVIAQLRKALGDDARNPTYIATVSTRGYRVVAPVRVVTSTSNSQASEASVTPTRLVDESTIAIKRSARPIAVAAVAGALVAAAGLWLVTRSSLRLDKQPVASAATLDVAALAALTPMQMTAARGFDGFLAFSPDGTTIAYASDRSGAMEIYAQGLAEGSTPTSLTTNGRQNVQPTWSPDGQLIAYHEMAGDGIWVVPSRGGAARKVSDIGAHPSWSPDGRWLVFHTQPMADLNPGGGFGATSTIWIVSVDGRTRPAPLTRPGQPAGSHGMPAWWPDGRRVMFAVNAQGGVTPGLWSVDVESGAAQMLSAHPMLSPEFAVSPDGRGVYFSARGTHAIWWLPITDAGKPAGEPRPTGLPVTGSSISHIAVSSDGRRVAWTAHDSAATIWAVGTARENTVPPEPQVLVDDIGWRAGFPTVASDGRVAFLGNRGNAGNQIYLVEPTGAPRQLTTDAPNHGGPFWLANDRDIAVIADHGDGIGYWALDPETGRERLLFRLSSIPTPADIQSRIRGPADGLWFARDVSRLAVAFVRDGVPNIWTIPFSAHGPVGQFQQRTFEKEGGSYPSWSSDGQWIAYQCNQGTDTNICVVRADGASRTQLTHDEGQSFIGGWAPDTDTIVFAARRHAVWNVTSVSRSTGTVRTLTSFTEPRFYVRHPRWDATNDRIVFERFETKGRLWSVELPSTP